MVISTIRLKIIKVAAKITHHARKIIIKLDETFVYLKDYFACAESVGRFQI